MQVIKSITARQIFKQYLEIGKQVWGGLWTDGEYIGTAGDGTTSDVIKTYVENQGNQEEKEAYKQMRIFNFNNHYNQSAGMEHTQLLAAGCAIATFI